jgi:hypothetical protein
MVFEISSWLLEAGSARLEHNERRLRKTWAATAGLTTNLSAFKRSSDVELSECIDQACVAYSTAPL